MKGQNIGYIRISSIDQNEGRQLDGLPLDRTFIDKASGKDTNRPQLQELLQFVREGDTIFIHSLDRLARNLDDLRRMVQELTKRGIIIHFVKESLIFSGDDSPMSNLLLSVMGAFAEFERSLINERQREGISIAKKNGVYKGTKKTLTPEQIGELKQKVEMGMPKTRVAESFGISRTTLYRYL